MSDSSQGELQAAVQRIARALAEAVVADIRREMATNPPAPEQPVREALPALLTVKQLKALVGIPFDRATIWRKVRDGSFPPPVKIGANRNAWKRVDIEQWIESRQEGR